MNEKTGISTQEAQALCNLRKIFWLIWKRDLQGIKTHWTWRESLFLCLQFPAPVIWGLLSTHCTVNCWPSDWLEFMINWTSETPDMVAHYNACERVYPGAFVKAPWNSWSNITYIEVGIFVFYQWLCDRGKPSSKNFWCLPFGLVLCLIYLGFASFNYHASISAKGNFYDVVGMFSLMLWPIVTCFYFTALLLLPQNWLKTYYWLSDLEFTFFKVFAICCMWIGIALGMGYEWADKSCSDTLWLFTWIGKIGFFPLTYVLSTLEVASAAILILVVWLKKKKLVLKLPIISLFLMVFGFSLSLLDYGGKCISGERAYYSTSVFQGVGLMHAMTGIAILVTYYFLRKISLLLLSEPRRYPSSTDSIQF